ncbi:MAG: hypothetical protein VKK04_08965 [Synechococcales bacterium]|nr:hypothetical protein [Synechococcales bacterium]
MVAAPYSQANGTSADEMTTQLVEVEAQLAEQEAQLVAQLNVIREKRKSLLSVIEIFGQPEGVPSAQVETFTQHPPLERQTAEPMNGSANGTVAAPEEHHEEEEEDKPQRRGSSAKGGRRGGKTRKAARGSKSSGKWQAFVKEEFQDISLPKAVRRVLEQTPDDVVEVATIIDTIFVDDIPSQARTNARDRLSNVLSVGLKNGTWHRGGTGEYSVSPEAAAAASRRDG